MNYKNTLTKSYHPFNPKLKIIPMETSFSVIFILSLEQVYLLKCEKRVVKSLTNHFFLATTGFLNNSGKPLVEYR